MNEVIKTISILLNASVQMEEIGHDDRAIESFIKNPIDNIWQSYKNIIGVLNTPYWSECAVGKCEELLKAGERVDISGENFVREHVVPKRMHAIHLREIFKNNNKGVTYKNQALLKGISDYLENNHLMCMITKDENERFKQSHPENKTGISLECAMATLLETRL